ncbi:MAG: sodium:proton antiporter, partial [Xanthomonadales bacterium]|nr:sodium:proton antiporter [Xanthomonadales bacterium]
YLVTGHESESLLEFAKVIAIGTAWGLAGGFGLGALLKRHVFPHYLENFAALAAVLFVFTAANAMGHESGLITVTVMGIVMANLKNLDVSELLSFKENLTVVLISIFFILLAARLDMGLVMQVLKPALWVLAVGLLLCRPLSVALSSIGTSVSLREATLISWVAPRGIVAAAVSSLFALKLEERGIVQAVEIVPLTFIMIIGTVVVYSLTAGWLAERLGLSSRSEQGVLMNSSNRLSLALGEALKANGIKVLIADTRRGGLHSARMKDLSIYYGNPLSEHADRYMDLTGYTHLFAMSRNQEANAVICKRFEHYFGAPNCFSISTRTDEDAREVLAEPLQTNALFGTEVTWSKLASLLAKGAVIKSTKLTEEYGLEQYRAERGKQAMPLFAVDDKGVLQVISDKSTFEPGVGWTLVSLVRNGKEDLPVQ